MRKPVLETGEYADERQIRGIVKGLKIKGKSREAYRDATFRRMLGKEVLMGSGV